MKIYKSSCFGSFIYNRRSLSVQCVCSLLNNLPFLHLANVCITITRGTNSRDLLDPQQHGCLPRI